MCDLADHRGSLCEPLVVCGPHFEKHWSTSCSFTTTNVHIHCFEYLSRLGIDKFPSSVSELLRSRWNLCGGNLAFKQGACGHSGTAFFMSETEHACSRLCHPLFSRQKIPKNPQPRSFYLTDSANTHPKCLSTSTAACQTSSIATRCPV